MWVPIIRMIDIEQLSIGEELQEANISLQASKMQQKQLLQSLLEDNTLESYCKKMTKWLLDLPTNKLPHLTVVYNDNMKKYIITDGRHRYYCIISNKELRQRYSHVPCKVAFTMKGYR